MITKKILNPDLIKQNNPWQVEIKHSFTQSHPSTLQYPNFNIYEKTTKPQHFFLKLVMLFNQIEFYIYLYYIPIHLYIHIWKKYYKAENPLQLFMNQLLT